MHERLTQNDAPRCLAPLPSPTKADPNGRPAVPLQIVAAMAEDEAAPAARPCAWCYAAISPDEEAIEIDCSVCDNYFVHRECVLPIRVLHQQFCMA